MLGARKEAVVPGLWVRNKDDRYNERPRKAPADTSCLCEGARAQGPMSSGVAAMECRVCNSCCLLLNYSST